MKKMYRVFVSSTYEDLKEERSAVIESLRLNNNINIRIMRKILMVVFALAVGCHTLFAESGTCGNNLTWNLNDSVLTIRGSGSMKNYNTSSSPAPWYSIRASINRVIIEEGVTSIGNDAFEYCENIKSVDLPNGITNIGSGAFCWCKNLAYRSFRRLKSL